MDDQVIRDGQPVPRSRPGVELFETLLGDEEVWMLPVDPDASPPDRGLLEEVAGAGAGVSVGNRAGAPGVVSLGFLEPVIARLRFLHVGTMDTVVDAEVLEQAVRLEYLAYAGSTRARLDLSKLPRLTGFSGNVTRATGSVLANPGLRELDLEGPIPKSFSRVVGPVEKFFHTGGRATIALPSFAEPMALRELIRTGPRSFDLAQVAPFRSLRMLRLVRCGEVVSVSTLWQLPELESLSLLDCATTESWDELPIPGRGMLIDLRPPPSTDLVARARAAGLSVEGVPAPGASPGAAVIVDDVPESDQWGIYMSGFASLDEAAAQVDDTGPASGYTAEALILAVVAELAGEGHEVVAQPDSESEMAAVYFPNRDQAEAVATRVRRVLESGTHTILTYLPTEEHGS